MEKLKDRDIREPLFDFLEEQFGRVRIIEEKMMGRSRADVIMVTGEALVGIEIKSDADTYTRLARQVKDYELYYDYNYVVVGTSHAMHIEEHVPQAWGIITVERVAEPEARGTYTGGVSCSVGVEDVANSADVDVDAVAGSAVADSGSESSAGQLDFYILRHALRNEKIDMKRKMRILWRPELAHIQQQNMMPRYVDRSKQFIVEQIIGTVPHEVLQRQISEELFERDYTTISETLEHWRSENCRTGVRRRRKRRR